MLEDLLRILNEGGVQTPAELARRLDVSRELLEQMLADLERLGYLKHLPVDCPAHCADCSLGSLCTIVADRRVWSLTAKGKAK